MNLSRPLPNLQPGCDVAPVTPVDMVRPNAAARRELATVRWC